MSTIERPLPDWSNASEMSRLRCMPLSSVANSLCWISDKRSASRAIACSTWRSGTSDGIVVGRTILFLTRLRSSPSSMSNGTQRSTFSSPALASTLLTE